MEQDIFCQNGRHRELVVVLHGICGSPEKMKGIIAVVGEAMPDADILVPRLPFAGQMGVLAIKSANTIATGVAENISQKWSERNNGADCYERIVFVGHSFGAAIARKVVILAHGETAEAAFEAGLEHFQKPKDWAQKITRLILLAGIGRGWSPETARDWITAAVWKIFSWLGALVNYRLSMFDIRKGAPFIIQTRLQWLALTKTFVARQKKKHSEDKIDENSEEINNFIAIQLLGTIDDIVPPEDVVDASVNFSDETPFLLMELPRTKHKDAHRLKKPTESESEELAEALKVRRLADLCKHRNLKKQARWFMVTRALSEPIETLRRTAIDYDHLSDFPAGGPDWEATDVILVIHGIRDRGFWTQKIARSIKQTARDAGEMGFRSFTGSYGYFAMVPFVFPWIRRWKTAWLMDQYVELRALYPRAKFSYVGHSNGTYLLARALNDYPAVQLERVVFAGSVVRRDYNWLRFIDDQKGTPRVREVLNYVATSDLVVAIFTKGFQPLKWLLDLGSAGHDGFDQYKLVHSNAGEKLLQVEYVKGDHSAGISETQWDDIARFIVSGAHPSQAKSKGDLSPTRDWLSVGAGKLSSFLVFVLIAAVVSFGIWLLLPILQDSELSYYMVIFLLYLWFVYLIGTKF